MNEYEQVVHEMFDAMNKLNKVCKKILKEFNDPENTYITALSIKETFDPIIKKAKKAGIK